MGTIPKNGVGITVLELVRDGGQVVYVINIIIAIIIVCLSLLLFIFPVIAMDFVVDVHLLLLLGLVGFPLWS